jgi:hypothetical protein
MWALKAKKELTAEDVREGSVFRVVRSDNMVETARVLSVTSDSCGIPHVSYEVSIGRDDQKVFTEGPRVLSLSSFTELYPEHLAG